MLSMANDKQMITLAVIHLQIHYTQSNPCYNVQKPIIYFLKSILKIQFSNSYLQNEPKILVVMDDDENQNVLL